MRGELARVSRRACARTRVCEPCLMWPFCARGYLSLLQTSYKSVYLHSDGVIAFDIASASTALATSMKDTTALLAPLWLDLDATSATTEDSFITHGYLTDEGGYAFTFESVPLECNTAYNVTWQAILKDDGKFRVPSVMRAIHFACRHVPRTLMGDTATRTTLA